MIELTELVISKQIGLVDDVSVANIHANTGKFAFRSSD